MGLSLGQGVFHITASTSEYEKQMSKADNIQSRFAEESKRFNEQSLAAAEKLEKAKLDSADRIAKKDDDVLQKQKRVQELTAKVAKAEETNAKNLVSLAQQLERAKFSLSQAEKSAAKTRQADAKAIEKLEQNQTKLIEKHAKAVEKLHNSWVEADAAAQKAAKNAKLASLAKAGAAVGAVAIAAKSAFNSLDQVMTKLDGLAKRARDVGMTASQLQEFEHQSKLAGIETGKLDVAVKTFNKNVSLAAMGTGEAKTALADMGISLKDANGMTKTQDELLKEVALKFAENAGNAENAGRATKIFGDNGAEMLRIFEQGGADNINKIFDAKGIDKASAASEKYKDTMENIGNWAEKVKFNVVGFLADGWEGMKTAFMSQEEFNERDRQKKKEAAEEAAKAEQKRIEAAQKAEEARVKKVRDAIAKANEEMLASQRAELPTRDKVFRLRMDELEITEKLSKLDEDSDEYAKLYAERVKVIIAKKKEEKKLDEEIAKERQKSLDKEISKLKEREKIQTEAYDKAKKRLDDLEARRKGQAENKAEYEYELKLQLLRRQGKDAQADALEQARKRNELMEKYGYSVEQANKMLKIQKELANPPDKEVEYSDEDIKRAKRIVESGKGGKTTQAEAQAILEGKKVEGGFKSATFQNTEGKEVKDKLRNVNVDAKATKKNLDNDAKTIQEKNNENIDELKDEVKGLKSILEDIKNGINSMAIKRSNS